MLSELVVVSFHDELEKIAKKRRYSTKQRLGAVGLVGATCLGVGAALGVPAAILAAGIANRRAVTKRVLAAGEKVLSGSQSGRLKALQERAKALGGDVKAESAEWRGLANKLEKIAGAKRVYRLSKALKKRIAPGERLTIGNVEKTIAGGGEHSELAQKAVSQARRWHGSMESRGLVPGFQKKMMKRIKKGDTEDQGMRRASQGWRSLER